MPCFLDLHARHPWVLGMDKKGDPLVAAAEKAVVSSNGRGVGGGQRIFLMMTGVGVGVEDGREGDVSRRQVSTPFSHLLYFFQNRARFPTQC